MPLAVLALVPTYDCIDTLDQVVGALVASWPCELRGVSVVVVDDGSTDGTRTWTAPKGVSLIRHSSNRGKGAALRSGFLEGRRLGAEAMVTIDGDGQHATQDAVRLALDPAPAQALLLGYRDMAAAGAPRRNQRGNRVANFFVSLLSGQNFADTQCGLRRYPLTKVLGLNVQGERYAYESEILLRAAAEGWQIEQLPVQVHYPSPTLHRSHYRAVSDTARIALRIIAAQLPSKRR